jgi:RNA polymerase sigma-70 factor (ECF subfamily)
MEQPQSSPEALFQEHGRFLWALSYRMTGSAADADDVVQETFVRALAREGPKHQKMRAWLTRIALNLATDILRRRKRDGYVGPWLPSPVTTPEAEVLEEDRPEGRYAMLESVSFAFMLALEELGERERAVLLLRDVFDYSVREAADLLEMSESNVKTTHHRARAALAGYDEARATSKKRAALAEGALRAFLGALMTRDPAAVEAVLAPNARSLSDGGGEFTAARVPVLGPAKVAKFYVNVSRDAGEVVHAHVEWMNGLPTLVLELPPREKPLASRMVMQVEVDDEGRITMVYSQLATRKLSAVSFA